MSDTPDEQQDLNEATAATDEDVVAETDVEDVVDDAADDVDDVEEPAADLEPLPIPDELAEAARVDGARPMRFFWDIVVPMSRTNVAALFVILFIYGWNQYLWPLLITTDPEMNTIVMGIKQMFPSGDDFAHWPTIMATSILAMIPPVIVVVSMQRLFIRGLVDSEK